MAKAAETKTAEVKAVTEKGKKGVGWRYCADCDHSTKGPKSTKCGSCGKAFPASQARKKANGKRKPKATPTAPPDTLTAAIGLVKAAGGFDRARAILTELEQVKGL
jgi:hypothetical protein